MSNVASKLDKVKLKKRECYPVVLGGETICHTRALTIGELKRLKALSEEFKTGFVMGCAIVEETGKVVFEKEDEENDETFAVRVMEEMADVSTETLALISQTIGKIGKVPEADIVLKN